MASKCEFCDLPEHPEDPAGHVIYMAAEDFAALVAWLDDDDAPRIDMPALTDLSDFIDELGIGDEVAALDDEAAE